ncbi:amino acid ABC transporter permease [Mesorhizobium sp. B2-4-6]|uniref:amino acid ABC transporter permease n=1 Tax=Mesorhizobium sp. B2-4-6 TaxID=2589943 RepID=UPI001129F02F|nr:amino acid ABC transporter permease [Mesorhizobium sp. B2-4-6]TPL43520.1 amino acid ABC transporter permease [Mesorhizobium sp. B2-4-6]
MADILFEPQLWAAILAGLLVTVTLTIASMIIGLALGTGVAVARVHGNRAVSVLAGAYVFVLRGIPLLMLLFLFYYGLPRIAWLRGTWFWNFVLISPFRTAIFVMSLNNSAYLAEIVRGGMLSVRRGLIEAGRAVGMSGWQCFRRIEGPIALRAILGNLGNETVAVMKASAIASVITVHDLMGGPAVVGNLYLDPFTPLLVVGAFYLLLVAGIDWTVARMQLRLRVSGRQETPR